MGGYSRGSRLIYFGAASLWGFAAAIGAIFGASDPPAELTGSFLALLLLAALVALGGGLVAASAYREAVVRARVRAQPRSVR